MFLQDAEKGRQLRSRIVQILNVEEEFFGGRKHWRCFSVRQDLLKGRTAPRSTVGTSSGLHSLRPCWRPFWASCRSVLHSVQSC